jgi:ribonuclease HI
MEMMAVIKALECIIDAPQLFRKQFTYNIVSDSAYIVNCFNDKWYERWWTENYLFVKNEDLWKIMFKLAFNFNRGIKFNFVKVKGHSGDKYNEIVDKLAHEARIKTE